jgi:hypothetical protein
MNPIVSLVDEARWYFDLKEQINSLVSVGAGRAVVWYNIRSKGKTDDVTISNQQVKDVVQGPESESNLWFQRLGDYSVHFRFSVDHDLTSTRFAWEDRGAIIAYTNAYTKTVAVQENIRGIIAEKSPMVLLEDIVYQSKRSKNKEEGNQTTDWIVFITL